MTGYFDSTGVVCRSPLELGLSSACAEDAVSAEGNAVEKALAWHQASGLPVFAEDSGLVLLDLPPDHPDQPGVHVRRVHGETLDDDSISYPLEDPSAQAAKRSAYLVSLKQWIARWIVRYLT